MNDVREHLVQQLIKAKLSMTGSGSITLDDRSTLDVMGRDAVVLLDKYFVMKPLDKAEFQRRLSKNSTSFMDALEETKRENLDASLGKHRPSERRPQLGH